MSDHPITLLLRFRFYAHNHYLRCVWVAIPSGEGMDTCPFCGRKTWGDGIAVTHYSRFLDLPPGGPSFYDALAHPACLARAEVLQEWLLQRERRARC